MEDAIDDVRQEVTDDDLRGLIEDIRTHPDVEMRLLVRFDGEDYRVAYVREDVAARYSEPELDERVRTLVMKGLGDPREQGALQDFGDLNATVRWYDEVVVGVYPDDEWSGLVIVYDREASPIADLTLEQFGNEEDTAVDSGDQ